MAAAAPFAQIGMAIGVLLRTKDKNLKTLAASGIIPGALAGTTELITYGILVKYKRTMVIVAVAGAIGGAINGMLGLKMISFVLPSVLSIPAFSPMGQYLIGIGVALVLGIVLTIVFGYEDKKATLVSKAKAVSKNKEKLAGTLKLEEN